MSKIDNFKEFVKDNPTLVSYVKKGEHSWQEFYELYDLYQDDRSVWDKFLNKEESKNTTLNINNLLNYAKNLDADKIQNGITSIQKAIDLFGGMLTKDNSTSNESNTYRPRPVYRRFDD